MSYVTIRIWEETRRLLRLLAADSGEQMVEILHRLCSEEVEKKGLIANTLANKAATDKEKGKPL